MKLFNQKRLLILLTGLILCWLLFSYIGALLATNPMRKQVLFVDKIGSFPLKEVNFQTKDGLKISAWYIKNEKQSIQKDTAIILLHGIWSNRTACTQNALFYLRKGYTVLMPDFRGSGNSEGDKVSFGWYERDDLDAAYKYLQKQGYDKIAVHGLSLGAATIAYSFQSKVDYAFVVMESCYDNIHNAFTNRVYLFSLDNWICSLGKFLIENKLQVKAEQLKPEKYIPLYQGNLLIMAGDSEYKVKTEETQKLFDLAQAKIKQLHFFKKGKHESFINKFPDEYQKVLNTFLEQRK